MEWALCGMQDTWRAQLPSLVRGTQWCSWSGPMIGNTRATALNEQVTLGPHGAQEQPQVFQELAQTVPPSTPPSRPPSSGRVARVQALCQRTAASPVAATVSAALPARLNSASCARSVPRFHH